MWIVAARLFRHSRQNTTSALEAYHGVSLKKTLNLERFTAIRRTIQWLLEQLEKHVLPHYMYKVICRPSLGAGYIISGLEFCGNRLVGGGFGQPESQFVCQKALCACRAEFGCSQEFQVAQMP